jgi:2-methylcitrate dehydratase PrpD
VSLQHFTDAGVARADILALAAKVHPTVDEAIERDWSRNISPAAIQVQQGNQILTNRTDYPTGHPNAPMTAQAAEAKLQDCLVVSGLDWPADTSARLRDLTANIDHLKSGRALTDFMIHSAR